VITTARPRDEEPARIPDQSAPAAPGPPTARDDANVQDVERRLDDVVRTILEYAALRFDARAQLGPAGDIVDAVSAGVNYLGEELEASFREIERRVADRTAELAAATQELSRRALHDELTGLPNRAVLWDRLSHRLELADRRSTSFAVLFLDLDSFKTFNDTLGHAAGDQLLVQVARRIRTELRAGDTAARVGGDEFVVLLDEVATSEAALAVAHRLNETLRAPYEIGLHRLITTTSVGVAIGPEDRATADAMVAAADAAMYDAKRSGGGRCVLYRMDLHGQTTSVEVYTADG
jgi:diguanylate cyclase (GGDEF)-like protein